MPKQKLYLTSTGLNKSHLNDFLEFYGQDPAGKKVAFIPTATNQDTDIAWVDEVKQELTNLGFILEEVDLEKIHRPQLEQILQQSNLIFVNGGNTFYLLYWALKSGFNKIIGPLLDQGKIYVGCSAGSILVGQTIATSAWKGWDDPSVVDLENWNGLNLVNFDIFVHYNPNFKQLIDEKRSEIHSKLLVITDEQAIAVTGDEYKIVGPGEQLIYD